jgi:hypothetical protein
MKEGAKGFNPFAGKKAGKEDDSRDNGSRKKTKRKRGARMAKGR